MVTVHASSALIVSVRRLALTRSFGARRSALAMLGASRAWHGGPPPRWAAGLDAARGRGAGRGDVLRRGRRARDVLAVGGDEVAGVGLDGVGPGAALGELVAAGAVAQVDDVVASPVLISSMPAPPTHRVVPSLSRMSRVVAAADRVVRPCRQQRVDAGAAARSCRCRTSRRCGRRRGPPRSGVVADVPVDRVVAARRRRPRRPTSPVVIVSSPAPPSTSAGADRAQSVVSSS